MNSMYGLLLPRQDYLANSTQVGAYDTDCREQRRDERRDRVPSRAANAN